MLLVHRKNVVADGKRPVLLSGYGGFNISRTPAFDVTIFPLLVRGDDFIAAAEWFAANGYFEAKKFAARLQAASANRSPVLIRVETKAGHGAGKPASR